VLLADKIDRDYFEKKLSPFYSQMGRPSMPVRLMVVCLFLKRMYNLGDETLAEKRIRDPYLQHFCGMTYLEQKFPCDPSDFVHFRIRVGEESVEKIFAYSVLIHGENAQRSRFYRKQRYKKII
tara:strand:+ start:339 stop:707 length:369 start_codon:yes stop_codon:yes gene_type:complete